MWVLVVLDVQSAECERVRVRECVGDESRIIRGRGEGKTGEGEKKENPAFCGQMATSATPVMQTCTLADLLMLEQYAGIDPGCIFIFPSETTLLGVFLVFILSFYFTSLINQKE